MTEALWGRGQSRLDEPLENVPPARAPPRLAAKPARSIQLCHMPDKASVYPQHGPFLNPLAFSNIERYSTPHGWSGNTPRSLLPRSSPGTSLTMQPTLETSAVDATRTRCRSGTTGAVLPMSQSRFFAVRDARSPPRTRSAAPPCAACHSGARPAGARAAMDGYLRAPVGESDATYREAMASAAILSSALEQHTIKAIHQVDQITRFVKYEFEKTPDNSISPARSKKASCKAIRSCRSR